MSGLTSGNARAVHGTPQRGIQRLVRFSLTVTLFPNRFLLSQRALQLRGSG